MVASPTLDWEFLSGLLSVIVVNVILSGDNAVVIAIAVRSLPKRQRSRGLVIGAAVLGKVGGEMILTDPITRRWLTPSKFRQYVFEGMFAIGVVLVGKAWVRFGPLPPHSAAE